MHHVWRHGVNKNTHIFFLATFLWFGNYHSKTHSNPPFFVKVFRTEVPKTKQSDENALTRTHTHTHARTHNSWVKQN